MTPSTRDRISVDLHGLKAALFARARARGVSPSWLVREALIAHLGDAAVRAPHSAEANPAATVTNRVWLSLRMSREAAFATIAAARQAGLSPAGLRDESLLVHLKAHLCRDPRRLRLATHLKGIAGLMHPTGQG